MKDVNERFEFKNFLIKLWKSFEQTGSISAFLLYNELKKKNEKNKEIKIKKAEVNN